VGKEGLTGGPQLSVLRLAGGAAMSERQASAERGRGLEQQACWARAERREGAGGSWAEVGSGPRGKGGELAALTCGAHAVGGKCVRAAVAWAGRRAGAGCAGVGQTREREGVGSWAALGRPRKRERTGPVQRGPERGKGKEGRVGLQQV